LLVNSPCSFSPADSCHLHTAVERTSLERHIVVVVVAAAAVLALLVVVVVALAAAAVVVVVVANPLHPEHR